MFRSATSHTGKEEKMHQSLSIVKKKIEDPRWEISGGSSEQEYSKKCVRLNQLT